MARYGVFFLLVLSLASCGRKSEEGAAKKAKKVEKTDAVSILRQRRRKYVDIIVKQNPGNYSLQYRNAAMFLVAARRCGDKDSIGFFRKELERLDREFRGQAQKIFDRAENDSKRKLAGAAAPEDGWYDSWEIWDKCIKQLETLQSKFRERADRIQDLITEAERRREQALLLQKAFLRFGMHSREAQSAMAGADPEGAVAQLAVFRAWLRSQGLVSEESEEAVPAPELTRGDENVVESVKELLKRVSEELTAYEKKLPKPEVVETGAGKAKAPGAEAIAKIPWERVSPDGFLIVFTWSSEDGKCETRDGVVSADAGTKGAVIEAADPEWKEFIVEFEARLTAGKRFWVGARPSLSVGSEQPEYRRKSPVELSPDSWHRLRIQALKDTLQVFDLSDKDHPKSLGAPLDLFPLERRDVRGGFMIGLEGGTKIELRSIRFKIIDVSGEEESGGGEESGEDKGKGDESEENGSGPSSGGEEG